MNVLLTITHPGCENFINKYLDSVKKQTTKDFKLLIINDGLKDLEEKLKDKNINYEIINVEGNKTIPEIRQFALENCKFYDKIILSDSDDFMAEDRVEKCIEALENCDLVINNLKIYKDGNIDDFYDFSRIDLKKGIFDIIDKNYFGFGNTSFHSKFIEKIIPIPKDLKVADWWIAASILLHTDKVVLLKDVVSYYRQYENNLIGNYFYSEDKLKFSLEVKLNFYTNFIEKIKGTNLELENELNSEQEKTLVFKEKLNDKNFVTNYIKKLKKSKIKLFWWEIIN